MIINQSSWPWASAPKCSLHKIRVRTQFSSTPLLLPAASGISSPSFCNSRHRTGLQYWLSDQVAPEDAHHSRWFSESPCSHPCLLLPPCFTVTAGNSHNNTVFDPYLLPVLLFLISGLLAFGLQARRLCVILHQRFFHLSCLASLCFVPRIFSLLTGLYLLQTKLQVSLFFLPLSPSLHLFNLFSCQLIFPHLSSTFQLMLLP